MRLRTSAAWLALASAVGCGNKSSETAAAPAATASATATATATATAAPGSSLVVDFRDPEGGYTAKVPGEPKLEVDREAGAIDLVTNTAAIETIDAVHIVNKVAMTKVGEYDCAVGSAKARDLTLEGLGCTAQKDVSKTLDGFPALETEFTCATSPRRGRLLMVCDTRQLAKQQKVVAYQVLVMKLNVMWSEPEARAFLDAFKLL